MSSDDPDNSALDALFQRAITHPETRLELLREMLEHELYTLVPRGQSTRPAGMIYRPPPERKLNLNRWGHAGNEYYFVFTSAGCARRGVLHAKKLGAGPMLIVALPGTDLLTRMAEPGVGIALNAGHGGTELLFNDFVLQDLLNGQMFAPDPGEATSRSSGEVRPVPVEEYPLALVQPVFDYLKTCPEVAAAWVLTPVTPSPPGRLLYLFALLSTAEDTAALCRRVESVLGCVDHVQRQAMNFAVTTFDYGNPAHASMMRDFPPFYASPEFHPAPPS